MRYAGQGDTITVAFPYGPVDKVVRPEAAAAFSRTYSQLYGRTLPEPAVEFVTWRLIATAPIPATSFMIGEGEPQATGNASSSRAIFLPEERQHRDVQVIDRYSLAPGAKLDGPLILQEAESTIVVARPAVITVLDDQTLSIELP